MKAILVTVCAILGLAAGFAVEVSLVMFGPGSNPAVDSISYLGLVAGGVGGYLLARTMPQRTR